MIPVLILPTALEQHKHWSAARRRIMTGHLRVVARAEPPKPVELTKPAEPKVWGKIPMPTRTDATGRVIPRIADMQHAASLHFGISVVDLISPSRRQPLARQRQLAIYLCVKLCNASYIRTGRAFNRDHTTVMHALRTTAVRLVMDEAVLADARAIAASVFNFNPTADASP